MERGTPGREARRERAIEPYVTKAYISLYAVLTHLGRIPVRIDGIGWPATVGEKEGTSCKLIFAPSEDTRV